MEPVSVDSSRWARRALDSRVLRWLPRSKFRGSADYWESRYVAGGDSGAGSYGATAEFKAQVLNGLVEKTGIQSVIEFGCGDGNQLSLAKYPRYIGLDVSSAALLRCMEISQGDNTKSFFLYDPRTFKNRGALQGDMAISLDVILHLVEDDIYDLYMSHLFEAARNYVVIFSMNEERRSGLAPHNRFRRFTDWIEMNAPGWEISQYIENPIKGSESVADFYVFKRTAS